MPQEMNVLRCNACKMFQVHIVKLAKKWQCKICNKKQSLQMVYFKGSGKACRIRVQNSNASNQYESEASTSFATSSDFHSNNYYTDCMKEGNSSKVDVAKNKWAKHLDISDDSDSDNYYNDCNRHASTSKGGVTENEWAKYLDTSDDFDSDDYYNNCTEQGSTSKREAIKNRWTKPLNISDNSLWNDYYKICSEQDKVTKNRWSKCLDISNILCNSYVEQGNTSKEKITEKKWPKYLNLSNDNQCSMFKSSNNDNYCKDNDDSVAASNCKDNDEPVAASTSKDNDEPIDLHNDSAVYEFSQNDYAHSNLHYEDDCEQDITYGNEKEHVNVKQVTHCLNKLIMNNNNKKSNVSGTKCTKSIFDDNEDFDMAIDF